MDGHGTLTSVSELESLTVRVCVASCMRTPKRLIVSLVSTVRLSEEIWIQPSLPGAHPRARSTLTARLCAFTSRPRTFTLRSLRKRACISSLLISSSDFFYKLVAAGQLSQRLVRLSLSVSHRRSQFPLRTLCPSVAMAHHSRLTAHVARLTTHVSLLTAPSCCSQLLTFRCSVLGETDLTGSSSEME